MSTITSDRLYEFLTSVIDAMHIIENMERNINRNMSHHVSALATKMQNYVHT